MSLNSSPRAKRPQVVIAGETNAGKSTLMNALTGSDLSIVSPLAGTTTDPVRKAMELLPFGPISLIDTAGLLDSSTLGSERCARTAQLIATADLILYVVDLSSYDESILEAQIQEARNNKTPLLLVATKSELQAESTKASFATKYPDLIFISKGSNTAIETLQKRMSDILAKEYLVETPLLHSLVKSSDFVLLVTPIDSEAPAGRLILPQAQTIRACLDAGVFCLTVQTDKLAMALERFPKPDLIITDSQAFAEVSALVAPDQALTSFSIIMAASKGNLTELVDGLRSLKSLKDGDKILIAEACTHNKSHEDIGLVKLPQALRKKTGKDLHFVQYVGKDYPENLGEYALVLHCGACMLTSREMSLRVKSARADSCPISNYGLVLAYCSGILERSLAPFGLTM